MKGKCYAKESKEEITLKNTKQEILDDLNEALEMEKEINKIKYDPIKEVETKKKEVFINETKNNVKNNVFSDELNNITVAVNAGKDVIAKIELTRLIKEKELNDKISSLEEEYNNRLRELQGNYAEEEKN